MTPEVEAFLWDCRVRAIEASLGPLELPVSQQEAIRIVQALGYRCDEQTIRALERERWLQTPSDGQWGKDKLYQLILLSEADSLADRWFEREIGVARP